uniref:(California timema) hypothetical protein n=1 Tax=Timema californicum TaxID=61474 RepID=A0A7R9JCG9_TIMCA|nr:unnamed protein product [Timema californicum]
MVNIIKSGLPVTGTSGFESRPNILRIVYKKPSKERLETAEYIAAMNARSAALNECDSLSIHRGLDDIERPNFSRSTSSTISRLFGRGKPEGEGLLAASNDLEDLDIVIDFSGLGGREKEQNQIQEFNKDLHEIRDNLTRIIQEIVSETTLKEIAAEQKSIHPGSPSSGTSPGSQRDSPDRPRTPPVNPESAITPSELRTRGTAVSPIVLQDFFLEWESIVDLLVECLVECTDTVGCEPAEEDDLCLCVERRWIMVLGLLKTQIQTPVGWFEGSGGYQDVFFHLRERSAPSVPASCLGCFSTGLTLSFPAPRLAVYYQATVRWSVHFVVLPRLVANVSLYSQTLTETVSS